MFLNFFGLSKKTFIWFVGIGEVVLDEDVIPILNSQTLWFFCLIMIAQDDTPTFEKLISKLLQEKWRQKVEIWEERENKMLLTKIQWKSNISKGD